MFATIVSHDALSFHLKLTDIAPYDATNDPPEYRPSWPQPQVRREYQRKDHADLW